MSRPTLAELMGRRASEAREGLSLSDLRDILGDNTPELPRNGVGRHRLVRALQQRFGNNWRSLPGVGGLVKEFDGEIALEKRINSIKQIKGKRGK